MRVSLELFIERGHGASWGRLCGGCLGPIKGKQGKEAQICERPLSLFQRKENGNERV